MLDRKLTSRVARVTLSTAIHHCKGGMNLESRSDRYIVYNDLTNYGYVYLDV